MSDEPQSTFDVFVSYSSYDKTWANAACSVMEQHRIRCWIAPRDITPGDEWGASIIKGLKACRLMVLVFSRHANASAQVRREVERAISRGMTVLPVRVEDIQPDGAMEYALGNTHWLDAFTPPVEQKLELLARSVLTLLGTPGVGDEARSPLRTTTPPSANAHPAVATLEGTSSRDRTPGRSSATRRRVLVGIGVVTLALGIAGAIAGFVFLSPARKPRASDVSHAIQLHFAGTIGLPPRAEPNSTLGEKRLIQAVFLSLPSAEGDLALVSEALRTLNDRNYFQSEGFLDVHLESVILQLATIRDVRLQWLADAVTKFGSRPSADIELPLFCEIDPSITPKPTVRLVRSTAFAELEKLRRITASP
jgi:hypothetical protein